MDLWLLALNVFIIALVHSLSPGHWFPVALVCKAKKWDFKTSVVAATIAALGHIILSLAIALVTHYLQHSLWGHDAGHHGHDHHHEMEIYGNILMVLFGLGYAAWHYKRHASCCSHHHHHGVEPQQDSYAAPFFFLFSLGFTPCLAALPILARASVGGLEQLTVCCVTFSLGVIAAYILATSLAFFGLMKLDHPVLEHYGDVIIGLSVAALGGVLMLAHYFGWH